MPGSFLPSQYSNVNEKISRFYHQGSVGKIFPTAVLLLYRRRRNPTENLFLFFRISHIGGIKNVNTVEPVGAIPNGGETVDASPGG